MSKTHDDASSGEFEGSATEGEARWLERVAELTAARALVDQAMKDGINVQGALMGFLGLLDQKEYADIAALNPHLDIPRSG